MKRLLIVGQQSFVLRTMRLALSRTSGLELVGICDSCEPLRSRLLELRPDIVLIEDVESHAEALEHLREVADLLPDAKRVLLTPTMDDDWLEEALEAGADAAISKTLHPVILGMLLRETVRGNILHRFRRARSGENGCPLTSREVQILSLAAQGHTNGRIARELWVTEQTVKFHLSNTYRKLGVANRTEATRYAYMNALIVPEAQLAS